MASNINTLLDELSERIEKLKIEYEKYFMGIEKLEPARERAEVARIVRQIRNTHITNTALKFRLNSLHQRFLSYQYYWNRILREIESGTYKRDLARVERDLKRKGVNADLTHARSKGGLEAALMDQLRQLEEQERAAASQAAAAPTPGPQAPAGPLAGGGPPPIPGTRAPGAPPPPPPGAATQGADERMKRLYRAYIAAKRKVGEPTDGITYDRLVRTLQKQVPMIQEKTGCRQVDFKIEIRDGKAILKAVPRS